MPKSPIVYLELPSNDVAACKQFYHSLFGWSFQVTRERIRQIEAKALRKLRHPSRSRKLKAFVDGVKDI